MRHQIRYENPEAWCEFHSPRGSNLYTPTHSYHINRASITVFQAGRTDIPCCTEPRPVQCQTTQSLYGKLYMDYVMRNDGGFVN